MESLGLESSCAYKLVLMRERRAVESYEKWNEVCVSESGGSGTHKVRISMERVVTWGYRAEPHACR